MVIIKGYVPPSFELDDWKGGDDDVDPFESPRSPEIRAPEALRPAALINST